MIETLFPLNFSHTVLSDALRCEIYFFRKHCQKLNLPRTSDLIAGGHFAKACELTRRAYYTEGKDTEEAIEIGAEHILEAEDTGDLIKSNDRMAFLFRKYFQKFPLDKSWQPIPLENGSHSIEYSFEFDLGIPHPDIPDRNIHFSGKLDMLAQKRLAGGFLINAVVDEKTTKSIKRVTGSKVIDIVAEEQSYLSDGQLAAYTWAAQQLGVKVDYGFIRRIPILKEYEPAFELEIPISSFMVENWSKGMYNKVGELVERYKYFKKTRDPFSAFTADYNVACNAFNRSCKYKYGCTHKEGEEILLQQFPQLVYDSKSQTEMSIKEYKVKYNVVE